MLVKIRTQTKIIFKSITDVIFNFPHAQKNILIFVWYFYCVDKRSDFPIRRNVACVAVYFIPFYLTSDASKLYFYHFGPILAWFKPRKWSKHSIHREVPIGFSMKLVDFATRWAVKLKNNPMWPMGDHHCVT